MHNQDEPTAFFFFSVLLEIYYSLFLIISITAFAYWNKTWQIRRKVEKNDTKWNIAFVEEIDKAIHIELEVGWIGWITSHGQAAKTALISMRTIDITFAISIFQLCCPRVRLLAPRRQLMVDPLHVLLMAIRIQVTSPGVVHTQTLSREHGGKWMSATDPLSLIQ